MKIDKELEDDTARSRKNLFLCKKKVEDENSLDCVKNLIEGLIRRRNLLIAITYGIQENEKKKKC